MKACSSCEQMNPDDAQFCHRCGQGFPDEPVQAEDQASVNEDQYWRALIGPNKAIQFSLAEGWSWKPAAAHYERIFKRFSTPSGHQFAFTWHWPAFLFDPFLWFLYRKMYMYALVYAIGPVISAFITGDFTVGIVWRVIAGASANYLYFWHLKDLLVKVTGNQNVDPISRVRVLSEEGGAQPYVLYLGIALHLVMFGVLIAAIGEGPPEGLPLPNMDMPEDRKAF